MGFPTIISMIDFVYIGPTIKARLILYNPDVTMRWFSIHVKAFAGGSPPTTDSMFGHQYVGYWHFVNIFRTIATVPLTYGWTNQATSNYLAPNKGNWREETSWFLQGAMGNAMPAAALAVGLGGYAIL